MITLNLEYQNKNINFTVFYKTSYENDYYKRMIISSNLYDAVRLIIKTYDSTSLQFFEVGYYCPKQKRNIRIKYLKLFQDGSYSWVENEYKNITDILQSPPTDDASWR